MAPEEATLRFGCRRCGNCCRRPGTVTFSPADVTRAAALLELSPREFRRRYLTREDGRWLHEGKAGENCAFFVERSAGAPSRCLIHAAKPLQCRAWPFWPEVMADRRGWRAAARRCPGLGRGPVHDPAYAARLASAVERLTGP